MAGMHTWSDSHLCTVHLSRPSDHPLNALCLSHEDCITSSGEESHLSCSDASMLELSIILWSISQWCSRNNNQQLRG